MKLARQVIGTFESELNMKEYRDEYQDELRRVIDAKIAGRKWSRRSRRCRPKVVNLMEALRKSLDSVSETKKKVAKADIAAAASKPARKRAAR